MRWFYTTVSVPKLLYAADLFLLPESHLSKGMKGFITRLARIQRQASIHITGALWSSPDTIDSCADLLPFRLLVDKNKILFSAASRMATLPSSHTLEKHVKRAAARYFKCHRSPTHEIMHAYNIQPTNYETITPCKHSMKWTLSFQVQIPTSKEATLVMMSMVQSKVVV